MIAAPVPMEDRRYGPELYGPVLCKVYDLLYRGRGKDFPAEAAVVAAAVFARNPEASSLLDVACGTGEHLVSLRSHFPHVEGLDLSPHMREVALGKLPGVPIHLGDMRQFELGRRFDAVCCLFSTIAYMSSTAELAGAIGRMASHLTPGGVLVLDPWWFPDRFADGFVSEAVVRDDRCTVVRVSHSRRDGQVVRQEAHFLVASQDGITHLADVQRLTLFSCADYLAAFEQAGCRAEYLGSVLSDRGLFVGVRQ